MWCEQFDSLAEILKGFLPYYLIIALPIFIIISPTNPVAASHEFPVYRMQQFDLNAIARGCRSAPINIEARSLSSWSTSRHCVVTKIQELTIEHFYNIAERAGALLIILPANLTLLTYDQKQAFMEMEILMLERSIPIPVYFAYWTPELEKVLKDISNTQNENINKKESAIASIFSGIAANGYQILVNTNQAVQRSDVFVHSIQGKLSGYGVEDKLPTIAIIAHIDSFGIAPELSFGADSNGSGVAALLELARLFSQLYSSSRTHGKVNLLFLLSNAGKMNFHGSKKWLEDQLDSLEGSILQDAAFVVCLDSLSSNENLYFHASRVPKEGTQTYKFYQDLKNVAEEFHPEVNIEIIHKRINLGDDLLAWEHERHSMRRMSAFTLSALKSHQDFSRRTILDVSINVNNLNKKVNIIAESLGRYIYNTSSTEIFTDKLNSDVSFLQDTMNYLTSQPRATQLISTKQNPYINSLQSIMSRYLKEVKLSTLIPDKREPEFSFYDITSSIVNVYSVKPAVFDLFLTIAILVYLTLVYFVIQQFPNLYTIISRFMNSSTKLKNY